MLSPFSDNAEVQHEYHKFYSREIQPYIEKILNNDNLNGHQKAKRLLRTDGSRYWMDMALKALDRIFLDGALAGVLKLTVWENITDDHAKCRVSVDQQGRCVVSIQIDYVALSTEESLRSSLVHEMLHGYVDLHRCMCSTQCVEQSKNLLEIGVGGHGWCWQGLAHAAEKLGERLWGVPFDLGRKNAALHELRASKGDEILPVPNFELPEGIGKLDEVDIGTEFIRARFDEEDADELCAVWKKVMVKKNARPQEMVVRRPLGPWAKILAKLRGGRSSEEVPTLLE